MSSISNAFLISMYPPQAMVSFLHLRLDLS